MKLLPALTHASRSMLQRLISLMLVLAAVLVTAVLSGLFLLGKFSSPEQELAETLQLQMEVFENDVTSAYEEAVVSGVLLSRSMTTLLEQQLDREGLAFSALSDHPQQLAAVQGALLDPLRQILLQSGCSGAFVVLDATVNTAIPGMEHSRSGLYLQRNASLPNQQSLLLYRGNAELGRKNRIMPHRKWRLEFRTDLLPETAATPLAGKTLAERCALSDVFQLPGTSERAMLLTLPLQGQDGAVYGLCGMELSQSLFQVRLAQPTRLPQLTCLLTFPTREGFSSEASLSCGAANGYHLPPTGPLQTAPLGSGMEELTGSAVPYAAVLRTVKLSEADRPCLLAVMVPKSGLEQAVARNALQTALLILLLLFFTLSCCVFLSRRFLTPLLRSLEQLRSQDSPEPHSGFQEIDDLFGFLAEKDQAHEAALTSLEQERQAAQRAYHSVRDKYETARSEIDRLAGSHVREIDPEQYQVFLDGISSLTPAEHMIFGYYLEGRTVKEILDVAGIKESTLRYHNRNIYSKLGVRSLKQLLHFAALMQWQSGDGPAQS